MGWDFNEEAAAALWALQESPDVTVLQWNLMWIQALLLLPACGTTRQPCLWKEALVPLWPSTQTACPQGQAEKSSVVTTTEGVTFGGCAWSRAGWIGSPISWQNMRCHDILCFSRGGMLRNDFWATVQLQKAIYKYLTILSVFSMAGGSVIQWLTNVMIAHEVCMSGVNWRMPAWAYWSVVSVNCLWHRPEFMQEGSGWGKKYSTGHPTWYFSHKAIFISVGTAFKESPTHPFVFRVRGKGVKNSQTNK